ncbi:Prenylated Rab acceptor 1 [Malassezia yamatoensis]|uniref:PRA1 family protein n=1 Tax=Malassezia yamatoensis TaxID=253288 RepID=A0AAJ5YW81_9BASI|nr:Prenylated Rab acceptor 1 [Malassezia yamatoensis]
MAQVMEYAMQVRDRMKDFRETRLANVRPLNEFIDYHRISRPKDTNEAVQRVTYNTRHFSGNYAVVIGLLAVYGLIMAPLLIVAVGVLVGGFTAINRFGLFVVGIVLLWFANPFSFVFWLVGSSAILILGHAAFIEPPVSSEYAGVETV